MKLRRYWVNQPSTLQPFHHLHGTNVLGVQDSDNKSVMRIYFLSGDVISQQIQRTLLSSGWVK